METFFRSVFYALSPSHRRIARRILFFPLDILNYFIKRQDHLVPPKGKIFTGSGNFVGSGEKTFWNIRQNCPITPVSKVLDIGCGIGRLARPFTTYLNKDGRYEGFDVVEDGIAWCKEHYKKYTNFNFTYTPLKNDLYNISTEKDASDFKFPYNNDEFDLIILNSVFTHMQPPQVKNYLKEIYRVMKKGGFCYCTVFLITDNSEKFLKNSHNPFFKYKFDNYYLHHQDVKDANIAFKYNFIKTCIEESNLKIKESIEGWWIADKEQSLRPDFQDILIITK